MLRNRSKQERVTLRSTGRYTALQAFGLETPTPNARNPFRAGYFKRSQTQRRLTVRRSIWIVSLTVVAGCSTPSAITSYGKDSYILSVDDIWGGNSPGRLQVKAAQDANAYCAQQGKVLRVRNTSGQGTTGWTSTSSTLIFSCITENDVENMRPDLRKEAETIFEDRRR